MLMSTKNNAPPAEPGRFRLYVRLGFGALIGFAAVGSFTGHRHAACLIFVLTAVTWSVGRIIEEAFDAWARLFPPGGPSDPPPPETTQD